VACPERLAGRCPYVKQNLIPRNRRLNNLAGFSIDLAFPEPLDIPPSVTRLYETETEPRERTLSRAAGVFRAALVGLLAQGAVRIHRCHKYVARGRGAFKRDQDLYLFTSREEFDLHSIGGALERGMLLVLTSWATTKEAEALEWPDAPPIHELIRAVHSADVDSPEQWVIDKVARDAVARGWGLRRGWPRKRSDAMQGDWRDTNPSAFRIASTHPLRVRRVRPLRLGGSGGRLPGLGRQPALAVQRTGSSRPLGGLTAHQIPCICEG